MCTFALLNLTNSKTMINISDPARDRLLYLLDKDEKDKKFENEVAKVTIKNKVNAIQQELDSYVLQNSLTTDIVKDYGTLLKAEDRKFFLGESSLFLVNYREVKLIEAKLKAIDLENTFFKTKASLFKATGISIVE